MEIDINILRLKRPELAADLEKCAEWQTAEIRLFRAAYDGIRKAMKAKPNEDLSYRHMKLIRGPGQRTSRKKRPQEASLL